MTSPVPPEAFVATRRIAAPAETIFAVLSDPARHADVHTGRAPEERTSGSIGRVDGALDAEPLTRAGQRFRMAMYHEPSQKSYETVNEVLVHEPSSAIAWCTGYLDDDGIAHFGGWFWRYDLAGDGGDQDDAGTDVTLTYDWSGATQEARAVIDFPPFGVAHLESSLRHLEELVASRKA